MILMPNKSFSCAEVELLQPAAARQSFVV